MTRMRPVTPAGAKRRLRSGMRALVEQEPGFARIVAEIGMPDPPVRPAGFPTLFRAIVAQQVSAAAARTVWERIETAAGGEVTPASIDALGYGGVRGLGLSGRKTDYALGLTEAALTGVIDFDALAKMPDEEAIAQMVALKGIGRWTAEVYLIFALARPDVWPAADLALVVAAGKMAGLPEKPSFKEGASLAEAWRPWRSSAAILLWNWYRTAPQ